MSDAVHHPDHYAQYSTEVLCLVRLLQFDHGNVVKYVLRSPFKGNEREDLEKALFYLTDIVEHGLYEWHDDCVNALFTSFMIDLADKGDDGRYRVLLGMRENDFELVGSALRELIQAAAERPSVDRLDEEFL